jgi:cytoskeleton-associated protein 5
LAEVLVKSIRIKDSPDLADVIKGLASKMNDVNINCVISAATCLEALAKGLMKSFGRYRATTVPPMLERLKERKQTVTDALGAALDAIFSAVSERLPRNEMHP